MTNGQLIIRFAHRSYKNVPVISALEIPPTGRSVTFSTNSLPAGQVGATSSTMIQATGVPRHISSGALPALSATTGTVSGTPTTSGSLTFYRQGHGLHFTDGSDSHEVVVHSRLPPPPLRRRSPRVRCLPAKEPYLIPPTWPRLMAPRPTKSHGCRIGRSDAIRSHLLSADNQSGTTSVKACPKFTFPSYSDRE